MKFKNIGNSRVSVIGFGTHLIGGKEKPDFSKDKENIEVIKKSIELGVNHIDTAEIYANGHTEEIIGAAIKNFDRKKLFIASKVWCTNLERDHLIKSLKNSLKRLNTKYLDLYYIHYPNPKISLKETMETLEYTKDSGLIKNIGLSNFSLELIKEAKSYLKNTKISAIQSEYNIINKEVEKNILPFCRKEGVTFAAYKPLSKGTLTKSGIKIIDELCKKYEKTQAQIALNWLINQKNVITIPKVSTIEHLQENINALNFKIKKEDLKKLDDLSISQPDFH